MTGSAQGLELEPRLEHVICDGIRDAARSTQAWVISAGMDSGVMSLAGRALKARSTAASESQWNTPLIGIAPLTKTTNHEMLADAMPDAGAPPPLLPYIPKKRNDASTAALDPNHSHFILVDHADDPSWGSEIETRGQVERRLAEKLGATTVVLVVQGGRGTLSQVPHALKTDAPVVR